MISITDHLNIILDKYNLHIVYYKYIIYSIITILLREIFYWTLIYFSDILVNTKDNINVYIIYLIILYSLNFPFDYLYKRARDDYCSKLSSATFKYFNEKLLNIDKGEILNFDLFAYYEKLFHFIETQELYILNYKNKIDIFISMLSIIIVIFYKKIFLLLFLLPTLYWLIYQKEELKLLEEEHLVSKSDKSIMVVKNYLTKSKNLLVNNNFNKVYLNKIINNVITADNNIKLLYRYNDLTMNIYIYIIALVFLGLYYKLIDNTNLMYIFFIIYDIELVADKIKEYYKNNSNYNKMIIVLNHLYNIKESVVISKDSNLQNNNSINSISINSLNNTNPKLFINKPIIINKNDKILISGKSGSGKTTLFYMLKSMVKPDSIDINPSIANISNKSYMNLVNTIDIDSNLYDLITDFQDSYDIENVQKVLKLVNFKYTTNEYIQYNTLSAGEKSKLACAKIFYANLIYDYDIFMLDEIDQNLDEENSISICNNVLSTLQDKIVLFISHNNYVKPLFNKYIKVENNELTFSSSKDKVF